MAGSYPDNPSRRMAHDADGTILITLPATIPAVLASSVIHTEMNNEKTTDSGDAWGLSSVQNSNHKVGLLFPELREIDGIYVATNDGEDKTPRDIQTAPDTTNIADGTWTTRITNYTPGVLTYTEYRDDITSLAVSNQRAIIFLHRFSPTAGFAQRLNAFHCYGDISAGETPDRLLWIDEITGLEFTLPIDYGDVPRGSARDREVRLKNNSGSLTANTLQITAEDLYLGSGAFYTFDVAGGGFVSTNSDITSLGSSATSGLITIRQILPDSATLGLHAGRAYVNVASWS